VSTQPPDPLELPEVDEDPTEPTDYSGPLPQEGAA
jgi:hypothetical protein